MKIELEGQIMNNMFLAHTLLSRPYLQKFQIAELSAVSKQALQRILPRLIKRGWIEEQIGPSSSSKEPDFGDVGSLIGTKEANEQVLKQTKGRAGLPREIIEQFEKELLKNNNEVDIIGIGYVHISRTFKEFYDKLPEKKRKQIDKDGGFDVIGGDRIWKRINPRFKPKEYKFYRAMEYPYLMRIRGGHMNNDTNHKNIPEWKVPKGSKRFWKKAKNEIIEIVKVWNDDIPRVNLIPKQIRKN